MGERHPVSAERSSATIEAGSGHLRTRSRAPPRLTFDQNFGQRGPIPDSSLFAVPLPDRAIRTDFAPAPPPPRGFAAKPAKAASQDRQLLAPSARAHAARFHSIGPSFRLRSGWHFASGATALPRDVVDAGGRSILTDVRSCGGDAAVARYARNLFDRSDPDCGPAISGCQGPAELAAKPRKAASGSAERRALEGRPPLDHANFNRRGLPGDWTARNSPWRGGRGEIRSHPARRPLRARRGGSPRFHRPDERDAGADCAMPGRSPPSPRPGPAGRIADGLLAALRLAGVTEVYRIGGVHAVGAMAFGTETIPAVDKIFGPGNAYVCEAKRQVFGTVGVDSLPGAERTDGDRRPLGARGLRGRRSSGAGGARHRAARKSTSSRPPARESWTPIAAEIEAQLLALLPRSEDPPRPRGGVSCDRVSSSRAGRGGRQLRRARASGTARGSRAAANS